MKQFLVFLCLAFSLNSLSQATEEEIEKATEVMMRQADSIMKITQQQMAVTIDAEDDDTKQELTTLPPRQSALLASIDHRKFTKPQLIAYLQTLDQWLLKKIPATHIRNAKTIAGNNTGLDTKAVGNWYLNNKEEAIYLALLAAKKDPGDPLVLSNLGSLLTMGGAGHKAIPILQTVITYYPENPIALNNIGQAYASLGEGDSAMRYLGRCISKSTYHPEANHTAGVIAAAKGNTALANRYIKNAVKAGSRASVAEKFSDKSENIFDHIRRKIRMPDYFNPYKYEFPLQCENTAQVEKSREEHRAFIERLQNLIDKYEALRDREEKLIEVSIGDIRSIVLKNPGAQNPSKFVRPFTEAATKFLVTLNYNNLEYETNFAMRIRNLELAIEQRRKAYTEEEKNLTSCEQKMAAANRYMRDCAQIRRDIQEKVRSHAAKQYEVWSYYGYLSGINKHHGMYLFYDMAMKFLNILQSNAKTELETACNYSNESIPITPAADETVDPFCPFDIDIDFVVLKVEADCDHLGISGGQGLKLKYNKDFNSGETTLSVGAGLGFTKELDLFNVATTEGGLEMEQSFYIVFDKDNNFSDIGLEFEASIKGTVSSEIDIVETDVYQHSEDVFKQEIGASAGYRLGMNTGFTFSGVLAD